MNSLVFHGIAVGRSRGDGGTVRTYAMQVAAGREDKTVDLIGRVLGAEVGERCFAPRFRFQKKVKGAWVSAEELLTPGYVYISAYSDEVSELAERLRQVPALTKLLAVGGKITPLSQEEAAWLHALTGGRRVVEPSVGFIEGDQVVIEKGPLKGLEAQIRKIDRHKRVAYVEGRLLGRLKVIKVGLEIVRRNRRGGSSGGVDSAE